MILKYRFLTQPDLDICHKLWKQAFEPNQSLKKHCSNWLWRYQSVQLGRSVLSNSATPLTAAQQASLSITNSRSLLKHVSWVLNVIQSSHPLSSLSPSAFNLSQHQGLFKWGSSLHQAAEVLDFQLQHQSFQDWFPLAWTGWISLQSKGLSRVFSNIKVQKHQFFGAQLSLWSNSHIYTWLLEKPKLWLDGSFLVK